MIIGNKADLEGERVIDKEEAVAKLKELGIFFMEVSAKSGTNIKEFFKELAWTVAGGKGKEDTTKPTARSAPHVAPVQPAEGRVNLNQAMKDKEDNKKCQC